jgi:hypothetical protein
MQHYGGYGNVGGIMSRVGVGRARVTHHFKRGENFTMSRGLGYNPMRYYLMAGGVLHRFSGLD